MDGEEVESVGGLVGKVGVETSKVHSRATSSKCAQLWTPIPGFGQEISKDSEPLHARSSRNIGC